MGTNQRAQIVMSDDEIAGFLDEQRTAVLATVGATGHPHLVAMWFAPIDGRLWFETKVKSQKVINIRRNPAVTVAVEAGLTYDELRGVSFEGTAVIRDDPDTIHRVGVAVWERYNGPYTDDQAPHVAAMMNKRVVIEVIPQRVRSWDHRKLNLPPLPLSGSTAAFVGRAPSGSTAVAPDTDG